jgi:hypothetical protein
VEQYDAGYHKFCGAMFNLPTSVGKVSEADGDTQAVTDIEMEVG